MAEAPRPEAAAPLPRLVPQVGLRSEGNDHFAVDLRTGEIFELNEPASFVLQACKKGGTVPELIDAMLARYEDATREEMERDVRAVLEDLQAKRFTEE